MPLSSVFRRQRQMDLKTSLVYWLIHDGQDYRETPPWGVVGGNVTHHFHVPLSKYSLSSVHSSLPCNFCTLIIAVFSLLLQGSLNLQIRWELSGLLCFCCWWNVLWHVWIMPLNFLGRHKVLMFWVMRDDQRKRATPECNQALWQQGCPVLMDWIYNSHVEAYLLMVTEKFWGVNQGPHTKASDLIYVFYEGEHHTPATSVLIVYSLPYPIMQDIPGVESF